MPDPTPTPVADPKPDPTPDPTPDPVPDPPDPTPDPTPDPEPFDEARARATIKAQRESEKQAKDRAKALEAELKTIKDAQLSDADRTKQEAAESKERATKLETELRDTRITVALTGEAVTQKAKDPGVVRRLIDDSKVEIDDDGNVTNAEAVVKDVLTAHPYLAEAAGGDDRPSDLKQVLKDGELVPAEGKLSAEAAAHLLKTDPDAFNKAFDEGRVTDVAS